MNTVDKDTSAICRGGLLEECDKVRSVELNTEVQDRVGVFKTHLTHGMTRCG